jgi:hypothetical protein
MSFPVFVNLATSSNSATDTTPDPLLPANVRSGNTLFLVIRSGVAGAIGGWPAGWVEMFDASSDGADDQMAAAYKKADGTEGASIALTSGNGKWVAVCYQISNAADADVRAPELSTVATGTTTEPNATTVTPTGGANDYLWLTFWGQEGEQTGITAYPTNYTVGQSGIITSGTAGALTTNVTMAAAIRTNLNAASEDAPVWDVTGTMSNWTAYTLAVHPSPPDLIAPTTQTLNSEQIAKPLMRNKVIRAAALAATLLAGKANAAAVDPFAAVDPGPLLASANIAPQPVPIFRYAKASFATPSNLDTEAVPVEDSLSWLPKGSQGPPEKVLRRDPPRASYAVEEPSEGFAPTDGGPQGDLGPGHRWVTPLPFRASFETTVPEATFDPGTDQDWTIPYRFIPKRPIQPPFGTFLLDEIAAPEPDTNQDWATSPPRRHPSVQWRGSFEVAVPLETEAPADTGLDQDYPTSPKRLAPITRWRASFEVPDLATFTPPEQAIDLGQQSSPRAFLRHVPRSSFSSGDVLTAPAVLSQADPPYDAYLVKGAVAGVRVGRIRDAVRVGYFLNGQDVTVPVPPPPSLGTKHTAALTGHLIKGHGGKTGYGPNT